MRIGGIQKTTFLDYPDKMACVIFTVGCNMRCPFCHNRELALGTSPADAKAMAGEEVFEFLKNRKKILEGVVISGGEPTLQPDLFDFIKKIKEMGYLVKLDTNGSNPGILKGLIDKKMIDFVAMDIKADWDNYDKATGIKANLREIRKSIMIIEKSGIDYQFRSTIVRGIHDRRMVEKMKREFPDLVLQKFRPNNCLDPKFLKVKEWDDEEWEKMLE